MVRTDSCNELMWIESKNSDGWDDKGAQHQYGSDDIGKVLSPKVTYVWSIEQTKGVIVVIWIQLVHFYWGQQVKGRVENLGVGEEKEGGKGINGACPDVPVLSNEGEEEAKWCPEDSDDSVVPIMQDNEQVGDYHEEERVHSYGIV